jgi:methylmalonyl-CoA mutase N-terminal domain/subunit
MNLNGKEVIDSVLRSVHDGPNLPGLYFSEREDTDENPELTDWLMTKSDVEGQENYTDEPAYWTAEELEAKTQAELAAIAWDLRLEVPQRPTKVQLLELILGEADEYHDGEES